MKYGASFSIGTADELEFDAYDTNGADVAGGKHLIKITVAGATDLEGAVYNVSGGQRISEANIVGVKINSSWHSVDVTKTVYNLSVPNAIAATNICKIAGRVDEKKSMIWTDGHPTSAANTINFFRITPSGLAGTSVPGANPQIGGGYSSAATGFVAPLLFKQTKMGIDLVGSGSSVVSGRYLPAGQVGQGISVGAGSTFSSATMATVKSIPPVTSAIVLTAANLDGGKIAVHFPTITSSQPILSATGPSAPSLIFDVDAGVGRAVVDFGTVGGEALSIVNAEVYAGPFAEVKLQSSSTKMVIGAVCVEGVESSATNYFLDNATKVVTATDASIFIEGGFGKLTLQTADYAGGVTSIGDAGDAADIDADGVVAIIEGVGLLGTSPYIAVDIRPGRALDANLEIITGGTIDIGGLSASVDVKLGTDGDPTDDTAVINPADFLDIAGWDLGLSYAMGDMAVAVAYDSGNDWGMSASMDVAGFGVDATIYNNDADDHEKSGLFYSVAASTSLDGFSLSLGVDQDLQPTINLSKSVGGLSIYAAYDAADEGGKVGATLSF